MQQQFGAGNAKPVVSSLVIDWMLRRLLLLLLICDQSTLKQALFLSLSSSLSLPETAPYPVD